MNKGELNLKEVRFINFFDYFALEQNLTNNYNFSSYYDKLDLLVSINNGQFYYDFLININNFIFINYFDILEFIGELEEYIENIN